MKIKIKHPYGPVTGTIISESESGERIGGIQKATVTFDANSPVPKVNLEIINFDIDIEADATLTVINYGNSLKNLEDMNQEEIKDALRYEAVQHWALGRKLKNARKEIIALKEKNRILEGK